MRTLRWYEAQLDREDLSDELREEYEAEANRLADKLSKDQEKKLLAKQEEELARLEKSKEIAKLFDTDPDTLFAKYGAEFLDDYDVDGCVVTSKVAPEHHEGQWMLDTQQEAVNKKKQLVNWRIYNHYCRN